MEYFADTIKIIFFWTQQNCLPLHGTENYLNLTIGEAVGRK